MKSFKSVRIICPDGSEVDVDCTNDHGELKWKNKFFSNKEGWFKFIGKHTYFYVKNNKCLALPRQDSPNNEDYFCYLDHKWHTKEEIDRIMKLKAFL